MSEPVLAVELGENFDLFIRHDQTGIGRSVPLQRQAPSVRSRALNVNGIVELFSSWMYLRKSRLCAESKRR